MLITIFVIISLLHSSKSLECKTNNTHVRLMGGSRNGEGRLVVLGSSGTWSSVCPDGWTATNSGIVCEELCNDKSHSTSVPAKGRFGPVSDQIRIFNTKCEGYEDSLLECPHVEQNGIGCFEDTAVGLCCHNGCDGRNLFLAPRLRYSASCEFKNYTVTVQYPIPGPDGILRPFYLSPINNRNCRSQVTGANTTHNWLIVPYIGDCDVSSDDNDVNSVKYNQQVLIQGQSTGPSISRFYQYVLPITCGVNRLTNKTEWLDTSPPDGIIANLSKPNNSLLNLDMVIKVFKNPGFSDEYTTPVNLPVGTPMYVQLSVDKDKLHGGGSAKIIVENCVAKPYNATLVALITHTIIAKQKAVDPGTLIFKSPFLHEVRFKTETFKIPNHKEFYLSCFAYLCRKSDKSVRCTNKAAAAQHLPNLNATKSASREEDSTSQSPGGSIGVQSPGYESIIPSFKSSPVYINGQLPGLGELDVVLIGEKDNKCYHIRNGGPISLYHAPEDSPKKQWKPWKGKVGEECLKQLNEA